MTKRHTGRSLDPRNASYSNFTTIYVGKAPQTFGDK
jgi:hypothetical protein